ncbi:hypothetical protein [Desulfonatronovibrio hydrogenovorans]|uniref:hypothetical protein n=1 Tax=Desulfonatronovibrio hydrogenovorans TaxID=53245 RepID=UPI00048FB3E9|nr:hypothetical protein [Desulfonatronovibrio hydrogenovorans]
MSLITSTTSQNPVGQYALVDRKTSGRRTSLVQQAGSVQKSLGFQWKNLKIEYQSQDVTVSPAPKLTRQFSQVLQQAREVASFQEVAANSPSGTALPRWAAEAYEKQLHALLAHSSPMISFSV